MFSFFMSVSTVDTGTLSSNDLVAMSSVGVGICVLGTSVVEVAGKAVVGTTVVVVVRYAARVVVVVVIGAAVVGVVRYTARVVVEVVEVVVTGTVVVVRGVVVVVVVLVVVVLGTVTVGRGVVVLVVDVEVVVLGVVVVGLGVVVVVVVVLVVVEVGTVLVLDIKVTSTLGYSGTGTSMFIYAGRALAGFQTVIRYPYLGTTLGTVFTLGTSLVTTDPAYLSAVALVTGLGVTVTLPLAEVMTFFFVQPTCLLMSALVGGRGVVVVVVVVVVGVASRVGAAVVDTDPGISDPAPESASAASGREAFTAVWWRRRLL